MGARTWTLAVLLLLQVTVGAGSDDPALHDVRHPAVTLDGSDGAATPRSSPPEGTPVGAARCTPENASRCPVVSLERGAAETDTRGPRGDTPASRPRDLAWLLDATAGDRRADWSAGLGFVSPPTPADDEELERLRWMPKAEFRAVPADRRRAAVAASVRHAWRGYRDHAWPADELAPVTRRGIAWLDVGLTIVDALDTLLMVGLDDEAREARDWLASPAMRFDADRNANVFESTIRVLGGLVAAHNLGGDTESGHLLAKALDLAEKLVPAFKTKTGIPIMDVNFRTGDPHQPKWTQKSSLSEAGTLVLEWEALEEALRRAENFTENFPFYELFADRLCYDVKKVSVFLYLLSHRLPITLRTLCFFRFRLVTGTTRGTLNDGGRTRTWTVSLTTRGLRRTTTTCLRSASISCVGSRTPPRKSSGTF